MKTRRRTVLVLGLAALGASRWTLGQTKGKIRRVGILFFGSLESLAHLASGLKDAMRLLGWQEHSQVEYIVASAEGRPERVDTVTRELVEKRVDVIVSGATPMVRAAQKATQSIPIVMTYVSDPVEAGLVASLANPDRNTTGIVSQSDIVLAKIIEALNAIAPKAKRIAILLNETHILQSLFWGATQKACAVLGLTPVRIAANAPEQLESAFAQIARGRAQALVVVADGLFLGQRATIAKLVQRAKLPSGYVLREHVAAGGLVSYGASSVQTFRDAAVYVDKILKGAKPADLPVQQASKFELVINLKTAKALGLTIPQSVLLRADEVIQ